MAVHGYLTHAARNRRLTALYIAAYILVFEAIGAFALVLPLLYRDHDHTLLTHPLGYLLRYGLPLAGLSGLVFGWIFCGHAKAVARDLDVQLVTERDEPRFVSIAETVCTLLGVRAPRFGVIEHTEPNSVTVGEGPTRGLIAVTRGLLDQLDDDELAAVLAHEASHIRNGDTRLLAANHALMRTAIMLQTHNPLRIEDWRALALCLVSPSFLVVLIGSSSTTMVSLRLARMARRGLKLTRDHIADGDAVRATHFPEALISALRKIGGKGNFADSKSVEGALFDGPADREGGSHPATEDRIAAITALGHAMMNPARHGSIPARGSLLARGLRAGQRPPGCMRAIATVTLPNVRTCPGRS